MRKEEIFTFIFVAMLFLSMGWAVLISIPPPPTSQNQNPWTPPEIANCNLDLWSRVRNLCPKELDNGA